MNLFEIKEPETSPVPLVVSVPHAGIAFPEEVKDSYDPEMLEDLDDTDWNVHDLYDFAPGLGITIIKANLSRWVIDLNRDPESVPLYNDNRLITGIVPRTDFLGNPIYRSSEQEPDANEIQRRLDNYYWPYYKKIETLLEARRKQFGNVLLWDGHSIRHQVPTIQEDSFPDMILGNNDEQTAHPDLIQTALHGLRSGLFEVNHNTPFRGGHITRYFGNPANGIHSLQLEMNKILYMDDEEKTYHPERAFRVKEVLERTLKSLIEIIAVI